MSKLVVLPSPVVPVPADQIIVVDELVIDGYRDIPSHLIRISRTNRTRFNPEALQQLADNIAEVGILQPILMRPVTPTDDEPQIFEIVAGERRFRASIMAGLTKVPASVRTLSDLQAAEIQLLENIQRENPHPLEEATGFEQLMQKHGYNADQLAAKIKQSRSYVYGRLKLCALSLKARELFLDDIKKFPASTALLIARIPTPGLQDKALDEIMKPLYGGESMSYREAAAYIARRYTLELEDAVFDIKDSKLLANAVSCVKCPKRTGNQPEIYADCTDQNICTDPDCFEKKKVAHFQRIELFALKKNIPILEGDAARALVANNWSRDCEYVTIGQHLSSFDRVAPVTGMSGTIEKYLTDDLLPAPSRYVKRGDGEIAPAFLRTDIQKALENVGACESLSARNARLAEEAADPSKAAKLTAAQENELARQKEREQNEERAAVLSAERVAIYRKLRARASSGLTLNMLRELAKLLVRDYNEYSYSYSLPHDLVCGVRAFNRNDDDDVCSYIDQADTNQVQQLIMDLLLGESLDIPHHCLDDEPTLSEETFTTLAKLEGISATAAEIAIERICLNELTSASAVLEVIEANIEHLPEVAQFISAGAPHHIGNIEAAANKLGYVYSSEGWKKQDSAKVVPTNATQEEASEAAATNAAQPVRSVLKLKPKADTPAEEQDGPIIKVKKIRTVELKPATAWPFPTTSQPTDQQN